MDIRKLFGANVRRIREESHWSQAEIAARMGLDRAYISIIERGGQNVTLHSIWEVAQALRVRPAELFVENAGEDEPKIEPRPDEPDGA
ncbi:MAG: helix-turn-helix transcriptional regulator [Sphingomonadaceae bacterium]|nr:helix-turn-helix transcriptional regulator [Sphingomonadaceae bacterium]